MLQYGDAKTEPTDFCISSRIFAVRGGLVEVFLIVAVHDTGLGELAHVPSGIDEEHVHVLEDEVESRVVRRAEDLRRRRVEQLQPDADGRAEVVGRRDGIRGRAHPQRILRPMPEQPDRKLLRQVRPDSKRAVKHAVRL